MLLDGKYIVIEKNKLKQTIGYLYSIGYSFEYRKLDEILKDLSQYKKVYITTFFDKYLVWSKDLNNVIFCREEININILIRESKLKRILK